MGSLVDRRPQESNRGLSGRHRKGKGIYFYFILFFFFFFLGGGRKAD